MHLTRDEQESVINFNEAEGLADVYTYSAALIRRLRQLLAQFPEDVKEVRPEQHGGYTFSVPKSWIKINPPRVYSAAQKQAMSERAKSIFRRKSSTTVEATTSLTALEG